MLKRLMMASLCLMLVLTIMPVAVGAQADEGLAESNPQFSDMSDDWSAPALVNAVKNGLLQGSDGKIMPDAQLTRAQMAAVINRAFGAQAKADIQGYSDVPGTAWYYDDMAKAVGMKTFQGSDNKLNPIVFCKSKFLTFAELFPQAPVGNFYVNPNSFN